MLYNFSTGNNVPGTFNTGHPEKNLDTLMPSRVAEVIRTLNFEVRLLVKRFIKPSKMSLHISVIIREQVLQVKEYTYINNRRDSGALNTKLENKQLKKAHFSANC